MNIKDIGDRIKLLRKEKCMTQDQFAETLDLSSLHISNVERGTKMLSLDALIKISNTYNISVDYI